MSYSFKPMTEEEIDSFDLIPVGQYDFMVTKSTRKISKANNPMAELQLTIWDNAGKTHTVFDYLVFSNAKLSMRKIRHFCYAVGLHKEYEAGEVPEELVGLQGKVEIGIKDEQPNQNGGFYPKKNIVVDYTKSDGTPKALPKNDDMNDEIPF